MPYSWKKDLQFLMTGDLIPGTYRSSNMLRKAMGDRPLLNKPDSKGRAGEIKTEYLFGAALAVIIIGSMVLALTFGLGGKKQEKFEGLRYKCMSCGEEFIVKELPPKAPNQIGPPRVDCPKCGAVKAGVQMVECPKCGTYFVPESYKRPEAILQGEPIKDVCPKCGLDLAEWRKKERERIRRERTGK